MKIRKLHLKNIGVFDNEEIEFHPCTAKDKAEIHIFTGQNGSGKSTILMALANSFSEFSKDAPNASFYRRIRSIHEETQLVLGDNRAEAKVEVTFGDKSSVGFTENLVDYKGGIIFHSQSPTLSENLKHYLSYYKKSGDLLPLLDFAPFSFSAYRRLISEKIEAIYEPKDFNSLSQSLEFVKDYSQANYLTINQLLANNFSKKWIESSRNPEKSARFAKVLTAIEQAVSDITNWKIEFDLQTEPINLIIKANGDNLDFDVLPDGLLSLISWIADLLGRVDLLRWRDNSPINEKKLILFLDEIEVHLHPAWQRKVLPVVQKLFKNSQIFVSTHSPFVVNSVDDAWVYKLELENGKARVADVVRSEDGYSYGHVLSEIFDIKEEFGVSVEKELDEFYKMRNAVLQNGVSENDLKALLKVAKKLAVQSEELNQIVQVEIRQINRRKGTNLVL